MAATQEALHEFFVGLFGESNTTGRLNVEIPDIPNKPKTEDSGTLCSVSDMLGCRDLLLRRTVAQRVLRFGRTSSEWSAIVGGFGIGDA